MSRRPRLPAEEKVKTVQMYLAGEIGRTEISKQYKIGKTTFRDWIRLYEMRGAPGLGQCTRNRKYPREIKLSAVREYLGEKMSLSEVCKKFDITDTGTLRRWIKCYNNREDFKQPNGGGAICMGKGRETTLAERVEIVSHCISNNRDYGKTVEKYGVSYQQVYGWVRKYEKDGPEGLTDRRGKRKDEDSMTENEKLRAVIRLKEAENYRLRMENDLLKKLEELERGRGRS